MILLPENSTIRLPSKHLHALCTVLIAQSAHPEQQWQMQQQWKARPRSLRGGPNKLNGVLDVCLCALAKSELGHLTIVLVISPACRRSIAIASYHLLHLQLWCTGSYQSIDFYVRVPSLARLIGWLHFMSKHKTSMLAVAKTSGKLAVCTNKVHTAAAP